LDIDPRRREKEGPVDHVIDNEMVGRSQRLEYASSTQPKLATPWTEEKKETNRKESIIAQRYGPSQTKPDRTEPWYFRKPTVKWPRHVRLSSKQKQKTKSKDVTQSTEPEPNKNAIGSHLKGVQSKSHERTFLSR
jgi:hypothetical protein